MLCAYYLTELASLQGRCFSGCKLGWDQPLCATARRWFWPQLVFNGVGAIAAVIVACRDPNLTWDVARKYYKVRTDCAQRCHTGRARCRVAVLLTRFVRLCVAAWLYLPCVQRRVQAPIIGVVAPFVALLAFEVWRIFLVGETWLHVAQLGLDLAGYTWLIIAWLLTLASVRGSSTPRAQARAHAIGVVGGLAHLLFLIMQVTLNSYIEVSEANLEGEQKETPELAVNFLTHVWEEMVRCSGWPSAHATCSAALRLPVQRNVAAAV